VVVRASNARENRPARYPASRRAKGVAIAMKTSITMFLALLAVAAVILSAFWAKSRVDTWEQSWRDCEDQISVIGNSEVAYGHASQYRASFSSTEIALREARISLQRLQDAQGQITQIQRTMVTTLEHKPFGLPLTAAERKELESAKEGLQKHARKTK